MSALTSKVNNVELWTKKKQYSCFRCWAGQSERELELENPRQSEKMTQ